MLHSHAGASAWRWRSWGDSTKPDRELRQTIEKSGSSVRARHLAMRNLGTLLRLQGRYAESLEWLEKATAESAIQRSHRGDLAHGLARGGPDEARARRHSTPRAQLFARADALFSDVQQAAHDACTRRSAGRDGAGAGCSARTTPRRCNRRREPIVFWRDFDPDNRFGGRSGALAGPLLSGRSAAMPKHWKRSAARNACWRVPLFPRTPGCCNSPVRAEALRSHGASGGLR